MNAPADHLDHAGRGLRCLLHCALHRRTIHLTCPSCRLVRRLDAVVLWHLFETRGWEDAIPSAWTRLFCPDCWRSSRRKVRPVAEITREIAEPSSLPYPDERTWKRVVSRYRS